MRIMVLATGGTIGATANLVQRLGAELVSVSVLIELEFLGGRETVHQLGTEGVSSVISVAG